MDRLLFPMKLFMFKGHDNSLSCEGRVGEKGSLVG